METSFLAQQFVPLMFCGLFAFLLTGFPVAFALAATGLGFGFIGMEAGIFPRGTRKSSDTCGRRSRKAGRN